MIMFYHSISPVPSDSLTVETAVSDTGPPLEAGSSGLTLTCTVTEVIRGLTEVPSAVWMTETASLQSEYITGTVNTATAISNVSLPSLNTSHAGLYYCQGLLQSPAIDGDITVNSSPINITIKRESNPLNLAADLHTIHTCSTNSSSVSQSCRWSTV